MNRTFLALAGFFGLTAVALGAFAAHGLKDHLPAPLLSAFQTGTQYQMYHALALALVALLLPQWPSRWLTLGGWLFVAGTVLFSGSLYGLSLAGLHFLGPVTPLGGLCFLMGWSCLIIAALTTKPK